MEQRTGRQQLSRKQVAALRFAKHWYPLRDGSIEQSIQLGISGAALTAVINALERRGLIDAEGALTADGERWLRESQQ